MQTVGISFHGDKWNSSPSCIIKTRTPVDDSEAWRLSSAVLYVIGLDDQLDIVVDTS